jgi:hypothetical protein
MDSDDCEGLLVELGIGFFDAGGVFHYGIDPREAEEESCGEYSETMIPFVLHVSDGRTFVVGSDWVPRLDESGEPHPPGTSPCFGPNDNNCVHVDPHELAQWLEDPFRE